MIAGPDPLAVEAGARVLADGGNAIDAAVTCAFAQCVVNPANTGLGGYALLTYQHAYSHGRAADVVSLDAPATAGSRVRPDMWLDRYRQPDASGWGFVLDGRVNEHGYLSICTPGLVRGLATALERWGTIGLAAAVEPAARLAADGYVVDERVAAHWSTRFQLSSDATVLDYVRANPEASRLYLAPDGGPQRAGQVVRNPDHAATLRTIGAAGAGDFYEGSVAARMANDLEANGAFVTVSDLAGYEVRDLSPVTGTYRGLRVDSSPAPHGGPTLLGILKILEGWDLAAMEHNGPEYIVRFASAMAAAFDDRNRSLGDPWFVEDPADWASEERAEAWRRRIDAGEPIGGQPGAEVAGTTQVTVVDRDGNAVSLTHSLGGSSGVVSPGLGFMYNNSMANFDPRLGRPNSIAAGKSRSTGMAPTILGSEDGRALVLGASGATKIIGAVAQVIVNVVDFGMSPQEAVSAPRFDCQGGPIRCHIRIPEAVCDAVRRRHPVERLSSAYGGLGLAHAVAVDPPTGRLSGGADPGSSGMAITVNVGTWAG
jgi:gamma-glutamyltranspeptidase/glutathione hydrolase